MLCHSLITIVRDSKLLLKGSFKTERLYLMKDCHSTSLYHLGKDDSINHMLGGGNGFPAKHGVDHYEDTLMDAGAIVERRDMRANQVWARDLTQALSDRKHGRVD